MTPASFTAAGDRPSYIAVGAVILAVIVISAVRERKAQTQAKEQREASGRTGCAPSAQDEERELCFLTDLGTAKDGHRMEDR